MRVEAESASLRGDKRYCITRETEVLSSLAEGKGLVPMS